MRDAGVKHFDTHSLGRTFIGEVLDAGVDIATVAKAAGHANVQMTFRYDCRGLRRVADIANSVPDF